MSDEEEEVVAIVTDDDKTYLVDRRKLIEKSDYFRALYGSGMRESAADSVRLRGLSGPGLDLVLGFIADDDDDSGVHVLDETLEDLEDLVEAASFLQVTPLLELLPERVRLENCVDLHGLAEVYGTRDLSRACLDFMACHYHPLLGRPEFRRLDPAVRDQVRDRRMAGAATLLALGDFTRLDPSDSAVVGSLPGQGAGTGPTWSMLRYGEAEGRWRPLVGHRLPPDLVQVRAYGSAVLDDYLFVVGGCRPDGLEVTAAHRYDPWGNEWTRVAPLNQKRSNFKLLAAQGKLYAVGGQGLGTVEGYSPDQDWWTGVSSMPEPLAEFSACECQGMIYVMGGYTPRERNLNVLRYSPVSDAWSVLRSCRARHVRKQQMLSVEDTIYLVGGYTHKLWGVGPGAGRRPSPDASGDVLSVQSYNVATGEWLRLKENAFRSGLNLTCALHNDGVYIMSRDGDPERRRGVFLLKYNLFSDAWEACGRFPALGQNVLLCSLYLPHWL